MLGDIVLFTYDELISVIAMIREEYNNNTQLLRSTQTPPTVNKGLNAAVRPSCRARYRIRVARL